MSFLYIYIQGECIYTQRECLYKGEFIYAVVLLLLFSHLSSNVFLLGGLVLVNCRAASIRVSGNRVWISLWFHLRVEISGARFIPSPVHTLPTPTHFFVCKQVAPYGEWTSPKLPRHLWPATREGWTETWGDRKQSLVFIGKGMDGEW